MSKISNTNYTFSTPINWGDVERVSMNEWAEKARRESEVHQMLMEEAAEAATERWFEDRYVWKS